MALPDILQLCGNYDRRPVLATLHSAFTRYYFLPSSLVHFPLRSRGVGGHFTHFPQQTHDKNSFAYYLGTITNAR